MPSRVNKECISYTDVSILNPC
uniref:Uncharacterized protein n=1 Tax=Rhizophora mucronata TaxID=61149 RepID=A0A2P2QQ73_RHIMU